MAIQSFAEATTKDFYENGVIERTAGWASISKIVARKLDMLSFAATLVDLKAPPSNRLEKLHGDMDGLYSIRVNAQWRIVFSWSETGPCQVRVMDYHR